MKKILLTCFILTAFSVGFISNAAAILLTFDDIADVTQNKFGNVGTYAGYTFGGVPNSSTSLDWIDTVGSGGWDFGAKSGEFTLINNNGGSGMITSSTGLDFTFNGLYSRVWGTSSRTVSIEGYNDGSLAWASTGLTLNHTWSSFAGSDTLIDTLYLNLGDCFLVDDLKLNVAPVPEPATILLLGSGLAGLAFYRRKRK